VDVECEFGFEWSWGQHECVAMPGVDPNTCAVVKQKKYIMSESHLRLVNAVKATPPYPTGDFTSPAGLSSSLPSWSAPSPSPHLFVQRFVFPHNHIECMPMLQVMRVQIAFLVFVNEPSKGGDTVVYISPIASIITNNGWDDQV